METGIALESTTQDKRTDFQNTVEHMRDTDSFDSDLVLSGTKGSNTTSHDKAPGVRLYPNQSQKHVPQFGRSHGLRKQHESLQSELEATKVKLANLSIELEHAKATIAIKSGRINELEKTLNVIRQKCGEKGWQELISNKPYVRPANYSELERENIQLRRDNKAFQEKLRESKPPMRSYKPKRK
jgi:hypothetical protein